MEDKKQLIVIEGMLKKADNPTMTMRILADEISNVLKNDLPEKNNLLKLFVAGFLYLMDKYFADIGLKLYDWMDASLPEVPENEELKKKREKLERKEKRMGQSSYKKKFWITWYKEWDTEQKIPLYELDVEAYRQKLDRVERQIREAKRAEESNTKNRQAEIMKAKLEELLSAVLYGFEASEKIQDPVVSYILQTANTEHFLLFVKRTCSILEADIKKNNGWTEENVVLGRFVISLKQRIKDLDSAQTQDQDTAVLKRLTILRDIALEAELFITEINNSIVAQRKQEQFQEGLQNALESGFKQMTAKLGAIESGIIAMNSQLSGVNGRLTDILKVNGEILKGIIQNGQLIGSLSDKLDGISQQISGLGEVMSDLILGLGEKK